MVGAFDSDTYMDGTEQSIKETYIDVLSVNSFKAYGYFKYPQYVGSAKWWIRKDTESVETTGTANLSSGDDYVFTQVTNATPGTKYIIRFQAFSGTNGSGTAGASQSTEYTTPAPGKASILQTLRDSEAAANAADIGKAYGPGAYDNVEGLEGTLATTINKVAAMTSSTTKLSAGTKSLFTLTNTSKDPNEYVVAHKEFSELVTNQDYYAFGTTVFMKADIDSTSNSGGFLFFADNLGMTGYMIQINSTTNAVSRDINDFRIMKLKGGTLTALPDSQTTTAKTYGGIYGGSSYKIDVKVKITSTKTYITAYINGFKVDAIDSKNDGTAESPILNSLLAPTKTVGMVCNTGTVYFDYVYGMSLTQAEYNASDIFNVYTGQFSDATISFLYGNNVLENQSVDSDIKGGFIDEFGLVAREIRKVDIKYDNKPSFPLYASTGINKSAKILGERLSSFGGQVYVLNNTGTYIPLDDANDSSFYILGKTINLSGTIEYKDTSVSEYAQKEPIAFESRWIQKNSDAISLAEWIKNSWAKKQHILTLDVFANPLISVGDIISVVYEFNNLSTTEKFVVTRVSQSYSEGGLSTSISCRTL